MKKFKNWPLFVMVGLVLSFTSCKKTNPDENDGVSASDNTTVTTSINNTALDASNAADATSSFSRSSGGGYWGLICGSVDTSKANSISITYDGSTCNGITRSGNVTIALTSGASWSAAGAVLTITINNVTVSDPSTKSTNGSYTLSGSFTITNVSGGTAANLLVNQNDSLVREHKGSMQIAFSSGGSRSWSFDRTFTWTLQSVSGQTVLNWKWSTTAAGGIESSGTNRYGVSFSNTINSPIQINTYACSGITWFAPYTGEYTHAVDSRTVSITFGTDNNGNPQNNPADCTVLTYGWYLKYTDTKNNISATLFWPYRAL